MLFFIRVIENDNQRSYNCVSEYVRMVIATDNWKKYKHLIHLSWKQRYFVSYLYSVFWGFSCIGDGTEELLRSYWTGCHISETLIHIGCMNSLIL